MPAQRHFLLRTARTYQREATTLAPPGSHYDPVVGAWILTATDQLFVEKSGAQAPQTKKADIETGEDQKGE
jgi:hypothetical protein